MEYIVGGYTMINDIDLGEGDIIKNKLGGSIFSAAGIKLWRDSVAYVGASGEDFEALYSGFLDSNGIKRNVAVRFPRTLRYALSYLPSGEWSETCTDGAEYEEMAYSKSNLEPSLFEPFCGSDTKGIYVEASIRRPISGRFRELKALMPHGKLMWEIASSDLYAKENRPAIEKCLYDVDIFSINFNEAKAFFGVNTIEDAVKAIQSLGKPCFFRAGTAGAMMVDSTRTEFLPAVGVEASVDPTGCGNCSTATALIGFAEGLSYKETLAMANISASYNARQYGPWPLADEAVRHEARKKLSELLK